MPRKKGRLTKDQLAEAPEMYLRDNARGMLEKWHSGIQNRLDAGDMRAYELVARLFQMDKGPGGVTIFNQHLTLNAAAGGGEPAAARVRSFDQIVLKLEEQENVARQNRLLSAPLENADDDEDDEENDGDEVAEAEIEEIPELTPEPVEA